MHQSSLFNQTNSKFAPQTSKEDNSPSNNQDKANNDNQKDYMKEIMNKIEMMKMDKNDDSPSPKQKESSDSTNNYKPLYQDFNYNIQFPYNQIPLQQKKIQPNQIEADLIENCATLCKEQAGCRLLQKKIDETPSIASDIIYPKIESIIIELSCDQFGNYLFQILVDVLSYENIEKMFRLILPHFSFVCFSPRGRNPSGENS